MASCLEPYGKEPTLAFGLAQTFAMLQQALAKGPAGNREVIKSLENGIRELYPKTHFNQACFRLYLRAISPESLATHLDPLMLVGELDKPGRKGTTRKRKVSGRRGGKR
ncbi:MAG TPA: hypothetical protein VFH31_08280 [Pyrinomonadaceae bacterium]|nr:hypothetical protein [Pyrinomonadaceae bacterium]